MGRTKPPVREAWVVEDVTSKVVKRQHDTLGEESPQLEVVEGVAHVPW